MQTLSSRTPIVASQHPLSLVARVLDSLAIGVALYIAVNITGTAEAGWIRVHAFYALLAILLMQFYAEFFHVYQNWKISNTFLSRFWMVALASLAWLFTGLTLLSIALIFDQSIEHLDWVLAAAWFVLSILAFMFVRIILNATVRALRSLGYNTRRIAIAGAGPIGRHVKEQIQDNPWVGYELVGVYDDRSHLGFHHVGRVINRRKKESVGQLKQGLPVDGTFVDMIEDAEKGKFDVVFITMPMRAEHKILEITRKLSNTMVAVYVVPDFYSMETHFTHIVDINGVPAVSVYENPISGLRSVVKRTEDIVLSMVILSIIAVPMIAIAIGIKLTSKGPIIFKQTRYGLDGKAIKVWKFRTMRVLEDGADFRQVVKDDPRVTRFGAFLRRTSLDELPQFLNVLMGTMSIVGPRPHAVAHNEAYRNIIGGYMLRHKTKPGITGWAQVNGLRGETDSLDKMQWRVIYDIDYIRKWSIFLDIKIILMTVIKGFTGEKAY